MYVHREIILQEFFKNSFSSIESYTYVFHDLFMYHNDHFYWSYLVKKFRFHFNLFTSFHSIEPTNCKTSAEAIKMRALN